jgi:hypothetical protein
MEFNWGRVLSFVFFWSYGFMGCFTNPLGIMNWLYSFILMTIMLVVYNSSIKYKKEFSDKLTIYLQDVLNFLFFFFFIVIIGYNQFFKFLHGDQLSHSLVSIRHSIKILSFLFKESSKYESLEAGFFLNLMNYGLLFILLVILIIEQKLKNRRIRLIFIGVIFISFRLVIQSMGGNGDIHPPFRTFALWISSTFFGVESFAFRLPQTIALVIMMLFVYKYISLFVTKYTAILISLVIGSMPVLMASSILAEFSIWSSLIISYLLVNSFLLFFKADYTINWVRLLALICIGILMRQSLVAILPGFFILMYIKWKDWDKYIFNMISVFTLIFLPYLGVVFFGHHPALNRDNTSLIDNIAYSLNSGISLISIGNNLMYWSFFIPFCFYKVWRKSEYLVLLLVFMLSLYLIFYNIRPILWGVGRYQIELTLPFVILGIFTLIYFTRFQKVSLILAFLLLLNIFIFKNFRSWNSSYDILKYNYYAVIKKPFGHLIESEFNFPVDVVLSKFKNSYVDNDYYYHYGVTYGVLPEIMSGFSISEVLRQIKVNNKFSSTNEDSMFIKMNTDINLKTIIFSDREDKEIIDRFLNSGWEIRDTVRLYESGTIHLIERKKII